MATACTRLLAVVLVLVALALLLLRFLTIVYCPLFKGTQLKGEGISCQSAVPPHLRCVLARCKGSVRCVGGAGW